MPGNRDLQLLRAAVARATKTGDTETITEARRVLAAEKIAAYIAETVAAAPPLTAEQRDRLAGLLRHAAGGPDAAA